MRVYVYLCVCVMTPSMNPLRIRVEVRHGCICISTCLFLCIYSCLSYISVYVCERDRTFGLNSRRSRVARGLSHVTQTNQPCHTCASVLSHIWMSHVTHMNLSFHTYRTGTTTGLSFSLMLHMAS